MKKYLIPENVNYYRANLHCHSTVSDGRKTPEQIKADYMAHGYSIIAYTDHNIYVSHDDLTDDKFLALNGFELDINAETGEEGESKKTCHLCYVALDKNNKRIVCYHRSKYVWGNSVAFRDSQVFDDSLPDWEREYTKEGINAMIKEGRDNGFFVTYNHPSWSMESYPEYSRYEGMNAMEIINNSCIVSNYDDDNGHCYDDLLHQQKRLYCIAADDNHNRFDDDDPMCDSYGGYIMIGAPKLDYESIAKALENGDFYTSTGNYRHVGPEIKSLVYEDGKVTIKTSPVRSIGIDRNRRECNCVRAADGETMTEATFEVGNVKWFRFTATDINGFKAFTNAYFTDELE